MLQAGDLLVSNFNNASTTDNPTGIQGTGSTIMRITPNGGTSVFFQGSTQLGLTTALGVLKNGFVLVGSVPTPDGTAANIQPGSILVLDSNGKLVETLNGNLLDSPWDLTINDQGNTAQVFVSNVVSGTVTRIDLKVPAPGTGGKPMVESETVIGSGFTSQPNGGAVILGPTGLAYDPKTDTLYVASTADNAVFAIKHAGSRHSDAGTGKVIFTDPNLRGPLGLVLAPNGDLIVANGDAVNTDSTGQHNSELIEFTPSGQLVGHFQVDTNAGSAFGLAVTVDNGTLRFAAVDDSTNTVSIWSFQQVNQKHHHDGWGY
jgi:DNA-binding beta-propeller fold protein YncE